MVVKLTTFIALTLLFGSGCGNRSQSGGDDGFNNGPQFNGAGSSAPAAETASDTGPKPCVSKSDCPKHEIAIDFEAEPGKSALNPSSKEMLAFKGKKANWTFFVNESANGDREGKIFVQNLPDEAKAESNGSERVKVAMDAQDRTKSGNEDVIIVARDMVRCRMFESAANCDKNVYVEEYDIKKELSWKVVEEEDVNPSNSSSGDGNVVVVSDPKCGGFQPTSDGQIKAAGIAQGINIFTGILTGNPVGIANAIGGVLQSQVAQDADPTEC